MKPVKYKTFYKEASNRTGFSEEIIEKVMKSFWGKVRESLSSLECSNVTILNLGTFRILAKTVHKRRDNMAKILETFTDLSPSSAKIRVQREKDLERLTNVLQQFKDEKVRAKDIFNKHLTDENRKLDKDLEEKRSDSRGN